MTNALENRLIFAQNQLRVFGKLLDPQALEDLRARLNKATEDFAYGQAGGVNGVVKDVVDSVLIARIGQIRGLVERKISSWNERFAEPFANTEAAKAAENWLKGSEGDSASVRNWIDEGWTVLKGSLNAPWGRCSCGRPIYPRLVGAEKKWHTFRDCPSCYFQKIDAQAALKDATQGITPSQRKQRARHAEARAERELRGGPIGGRGKGKGKKK